MTPPATATPGTTQADLPRVGKRFYGWVIVAVTGVAGATSMGMALFNIGLFIKPMGDELGIGRAAFGWSQTLRQVGGALTAPLLGRLIDRHGARGLLPLAVLITALAMVGLGFARDTRDLLIAVAIIGLAGYSTPGSLLTTVPVMKWFERDRGRAMAVWSAATLIGGMVFIPLTQWLIDAYGWRQAWWLLAALGCALVMPLALWLLRRQPEDFGLRPDGDAAPDAATTDAGGDAAAHQWTLREASRSLSFWWLVAMFSLMSLSLATIGLHRIPEFMDRGLAPMWVAWAMALDSVLAGVASVATGLYAHRIRLQWLGALGFTLLAAACWLTIVAHDTPMMLLSMGLFGIGIGINIQLQNLIWPEFFGRLHIGSIRGAVMPITLGASAIGAPFAGYVFDSGGSYDPVWWGALVLMLVGAGIALCLRKPQRR